MTILNPGNPSHASEILSDLAKSIALKRGIEMSRYDVLMTQDPSDTVHWMYNFDAYENRIYRVHKGFQRFENINLGTSGLLDMDNVDFQINSAIEELQRKAH